MCDPAKVHQPQGECSVYNIPYIVPLNELGLTGMGTNIDWQSMLTQLQAVSEQSLDTVQ